MGFENKRNCVHMKEIISHSGKLYAVKRSITHNQFNKKDGTFVPAAISLWKDWLGVDMTLKNQTHYLFCNEIEDIECETITTK